MDLLLKLTIGPFTKEHLSKIFPRAVVETQNINRFGRVTICGNQALWEALMQQEGMDGVNWKVVERRYRLLREDPIKQKEGTDRRNAETAESKSNANFARRLAKDKPERHLTKKDCIDIWDTKMNANPAFYERLKQKGTLKHFYAHTGGNRNARMTNQTFEGSGAARGAGPSGFLLRETEKRIGVHDWLIPSREVLLLATGLESYNWRLLEKTATSQLEKLGFKRSTHKELRTIINIRRGGGGAPGQKDEQQIRTDSVSLEIFDRDAFNAAFIRRALVKAK